MKMIALILGTALAYGTVLLDYSKRWKDGRTRLNRWARRTLHVVVLVALPVGVWNVYSDDEANGAAVANAQAMKKSLEQANGKLDEAKLNGLVTSRKLDEANAKLR